jgi:hypothetical protein
VVAYRKLGHALSDCLHYAGAIRHRNAPVRRSDPSGNDEVVVIVERAPVKPDPDLARGRRTGVGHLDHFQSIKSARCA